MMSADDLRITNLMFSRLWPLYVLLHIRLGNTANMVTLRIDCISMNPRSLVIHLGLCWKSVMIKT